MEKPKSRRSLSGGFYLFTGFSALSMTMNSLMQSRYATNYTSFRKECSQKNWGFFGYRLILFRWGRARVNSLRSLAPLALALTEKVACPVGQTNIQGRSKS